MAREKRPVIVPYSLKNIIRKYQKLIAGVSSKYLEKGK